MFASPEGLLSPIWLPIVALVASTVAGALTNYLRLKNRTASSEARLAEPRPDLLLRDGERFDRLCLNATRSLEAAVAVTVAITALSVQLLHKGVPRLTMAGFLMSGMAMAISLIGGILVISTPLRIDRRRDLREAAHSSGSLGSVDELVKLRRDAWLGLITRLVRDRFDCVVADRSDHLYVYRSAGGSGPAVDNYPSTLFVEGGITQCHNL